MNHNLTKVLQQLSFEIDGQPKLWLKLVLLRDQITGEPRKIASRIIFKKNGCVRPIFADWYQRYLQQENGAKFAPYLSFIRGKVAGGSLGRTQTLHIVATLHTEIVAISLAECLSGTRINVTWSTAMPEEFSHDLYLVVAPQMFDRMPPQDRTIVMQMEQVRASNWVTPKYLELISKSLAILDYSIDNIRSLIDRGLPSRQVFFLPLIPYRSVDGAAADKDIDVLFYGALSSRRRKEYLNALSGRFNVRVESNLFGEDLRRIISRSKVVVNIHHYEGAILETTRILESVMYGARVVSETSKDQVYHGSLQKMVTFVPCGDIPAFLRAVEKELRATSQDKYTIKENSLNGTKYHLLRALNAIGVLSYDELIDQLGEVKLPSGRLVLALPEQCDRYDFAFSGIVPGAVMFHGLRHVDGWKGCALSYKLLATLALREGRRQVMVYEDDALLPENLVNRLDVVEEYLELNSDRWDVFSGLITDVPATVDVSEVESYKGESFVHTNTFVGMVFCIYGSEVLDLMSRFQFNGEDISKDTVDRFLEAQRVRCVTTIDPLVGHAEEFASSIWNNKNIHSASMISRSSERLKEAARRHAYF